MLEKKDYREIANLMKVIVEGDITPKLNALADGHSLLLETLASMNWKKKLDF